MLEILSLIRQDGDPRWCRSVPNWERGPWLETLLGYRRARGNARPRIISSHLPASRRARGNARPRIISSHLPVHLFPRAFFGSKAKV
ncbi:ST2A1 sulfotransferase, partial [Buphagus erythrorhynchus]|nr:ST2A1 sulfotransferase [Buphagus erythrorhynchus]